jgi:hypothetical protein
VRQRGLLFSGTEREVYFSVDDGENWQSLRLNMPATSIRDLVVHENDLVLGTHGRSIWILDDISPLRGMATAIKSDHAVLFEPAMATRVRFNMFLDTPLPPEEPAGQNPPDGAILDYALPKQVNQVKLEIFDQGGKLVRTYSSNDSPEKLDSAQLQHPLYWVRPLMTLAASPGHHRFIWDLRFEEPKGADKGLAIAAVYQNTASGPSGPFVSPGNYIVRLTVDGRISERSIQVRMDPRVSISDSDLKLQTDLSMQCYNSYKALQIIRDEMDARLSDTKRKLKEEPKKQIVNLRGTGKPDAGDILYSSIYEAPLEQETIVGLQDKFLFLLGILQSSDSKPTTQAQDGVIKLTQRLAEISEKWVKIK